ncbi:MAG: menaquinone biosynthesis protein [Desulfobacteraceae bacterium]|nr:menaquinone biosynthesis protein [Desulfobacteraceae bacterium]
MNKILHSNFRKPAVNIGRISYMNVAPIYYGLDNGMKPSWINMVSAPPSTLNRMLAHGELDISPVSSAAFARNQDEWLLLPGLSIACFGEVMSVILVSKYPFEQLADKKVILTEESATAVELLKLLFVLQGVVPHFETGKIRNADDFSEDAAAALVIGDAALKEKWGSHFDYVWDLGKMWWELTGLPFVFALWAVRKSFADEKPELVSSIIDLFHISRDAGCMNINKIIPRASEKLELRTDICRKYYDKLHFDLDLPEIKGAEAFFEGLFNQRIIQKKAQLSFFDYEQSMYATSHAA